jgi:hypothetical protein
MNRDNPNRALISSAILAFRLGISPSVLHRWRRERSPEGQRLRACIHRATKRSTYWHVERLRQAGYLTNAVRPAAESADAAAIVVQWTAGVL